MYERYSNTDAYYAEQAICWEAGCDLSREAPQEIVIPMRWVGLWLGTVFSLSIGLGSLINWLV